MKQLTLLITATLTLAACQAPVPSTSGRVNQAAPATVVAPVALPPQQAALPMALPVVLPKSPVLRQIDFKPEGVVVIQNQRVSLELKLPPLPEEGFKTQALDLAAAAKIVATVTDSHGLSYTPVGAVAGEVNYPASGNLSLTFENVVPDQLLFLELQIKDGTGNIPQATLASVVSETGTADVNAPVNFQTTPTALAMKALVASDAARARAIDLPALVTKMTEITGITGGANPTYTTHPTLVNTSQLATDLAGSQPGTLTANDYRLNGATVAVTVQGLVGSDTMEVQITDAASARATALGNGLTNITKATPGAGINVLMGATTTPANSTQYTFAASTNPITLTEGATTAITVTATPVAVNVTNVAPTSGRVGSTVTLTGTGFSTVTTNNTVRFGTTLATVSSVNATGTSMDVVVPANVSGAQSVTVQVGTQTSTGVTYNVIPSITNISAASGAIGSTLTITGTGFDDTDANNTVSFGGTNASITSATPTSIVVSVPAGVSGANNVTVTVNGQVSTETRTFNITPVLTSLSANNGVPGTSITLTGTGFSSTLASNVVNFGPTAGTVTAVNGARTQLTVTIPNVAGTQNVNITVAGQTSGNQSFESRPGITTVSPTSGSTGDSITLTGVGFDATDANNTVEFGGVMATVTSATSTQIVATLTEAPAGTANATVQVGNQTSTGSTFTRLPEITTLTTATTEGGKAVLIRSEVLTITGTNFDPTKANNSVRFTMSDSSTATVTGANLVSAKATEIQVRVPGDVDDAGDVTVRVTTNTQNSNNAVGTVPQIDLNFTGGFQ